MESTQAEFVDLLLKVTRQLRVRFDTRLRANGITLARARTLLILRKNDGLLQKDLAHSLSIKNATLVRLLDALETQNLITRKDVREDKRAKSIFLTPQGRILADKINLFSVEVRSQFLEGVKQTQLQQTIDLLKKMKNHIGHEPTIFMEKGEHYE